MKQSKWQGLLLSAMMMFATSTCFAGVTGKEVLHWSGDSSNRYDVVIIGEGYTADEMDRFHRDAQGAYLSLTLIAPYSDYINYMNVVRVDYASPESGITEKGVKEVNSGFGTLYNPDSMNYLKVKPGRIKSAVASAVNDADAILCIMNGASGGRSYGKVCVASNMYLEWGDNVCVHELGHTIGRNGDEYNNTDLKLPGWLNKVGESIARPFLPLYYGFEFKNVTAKTSRKNIPWSHWLESDVKLPTAESDGRTGLYEGALYMKTGWYRPVPNCMMRHGSKHCSPCAERIVLKISDKVVPHVFKHETVGGKTRCSIETLVPGPLRTKWFLDGKLVARGKTTIEVTSEAMRKKKQSLYVEVQDATALVRLDEDRILIHQHEWKLKNKNGKVTVRDSDTRKNRDGILGWFQSIFNPLKGSWPELRPAPVLKDPETTPPPVRRSTGAAGALDGLVK